MERHAYVLGTACCKGTWETRFRAPVPQITQMLAVGLAVTCGLSLLGQEVGCRIPAFWHYHRWRLTCASNGFSIPSSSWGRKSNPILSSTASMLVT